MNVARSDHTATLLPSGQVMVAGGYLECDVHGCDTSLRSAELFDLGIGEPSSWAYNFAGGYMIGLGTEAAVRAVRTVSD